MTFSRATKQTFMRTLAVCVFLLIISVVRIPSPIAHADDSTTTPSSAPASTDSASLLSSNATTSAPATPTVTPSTPDTSNNGSSSPAVVATGDAASAANTTTGANTNTTGSDPTIITGTLASTTANIDLRPLVGTSSDPGTSQNATSSYGGATTSTSALTDGGGCPTGCDASSTLTVDNQNSADVTNSVAVVADTGSNRADSNSGDAAISTGNAYAAANIINLLNTNFIGSHLTAIAINQLGNWLGDLVFPGAWFFEGDPSSVAPSPSVPAVLDVSNTNSADVTNNVAVVADTGSNQANGNGGGSTIATGQSVALANILNIINSNIVFPGGTLGSIYINIGGSWTGKVFSLPKGMRLINNGGTLVIETDDFASLSALSTPTGGALQSSNTNDAVLTNNVSVTANTGGNTANNNGGTGRIMTGNAYAAVNILNVVNTNVIGRNWFLALINIAGNWNGNIAFGRPDLWLGESGALPTHAPGPASTYTYTLTMVNHGDADATNVRLTDSFDSRYVHVQNPGGGTTDGSGGISWDVGTIPAGGRAIRSYTVKLADLPEHETDLINTSVVTATEPDQNPADNRESLTVKAYNEFSDPAGGSWPPELSITKINNTTGPITASSTVGYRIKVKNTGTGPAYRTIITDTVENPDGKEINASSWDLGDVFPGDEIIISYDLQFSAAASPGEYTNTAHVEGYGGTQTGYVVGAEAHSVVTIAGASTTPPTEPDIETNPDGTAVGEIPSSVLPGKPTIEKKHTPVLPRPRAFLGSPNTRLLAVACPLVPTLAPLPVRWYTNFSQISAISFPFQFSTSTIPFLFPFAGLL